MFFTSSSVHKKREPSHNNTTERPSIICRSILRDRGTQMLLSGAGSGQPYSMGYSTSLPYRQRAMQESYDSRCQATDNIRLMTRISTQQRRKKQHRPLFAAALITWVSTLGPAFVLQQSAPSSFLVRFGRDLKWPSFDCSSLLLKSEMPQG